MSTATDQPVDQTTTAEEVDALAQTALSAFAVTSAASDAERAAWLRAIAAALDAAADELWALADEETHLGETRLRGEIARTTGQLRLFASVVEDGAYLEAVVDHADPSAAPPKPDLRRLLVPLGPVAVYSASNFPFAFSVAGGDTASALAVGCPVIVKAHSGHPRLSRRTAEIVSAALSDAGAPEGTFALIEGRLAGVALIEHPAIAAAGFTGSVGGGRALFDRAAARPVPIPFYGELGSVNPVVVTAAADAARGSALAEGLAGSFQLGVGQFCTKPGIVFVPSGSSLEKELPAHVGTAGPLMLNAGIAAGFADAFDGVAAGAELIAGGTSEDVLAPAPRVLAVDAPTFAAHAEALGQEMFGPATLLVRYDDEQQLLTALAEVEGSLTATLHAEPDEQPSAVLASLTERAGRVLFGGWPTGVAVTWSQHHGGPYPATTSQHTSVGATAARRFQRPVAFQDAPEWALPEALRESNPLGIPRRVDGVLTV